MPARLLNATRNCLLAQPRATSSYRHKDLFSCLEVELPWHNYTTPINAWLEAFPPEQVMLVQVRGSDGGWMCGGYGVGGGADVWRELLRCLPPHQCVCVCCSSALTSAHPAVMCTPAVREPYF